MAVTGFGGGGFERGGFFRDPDQLSISFRGEQGAARGQRVGGHERERVSVDPDFEGYVRLTRFFWVELGFSQRRMAFRCYGIRSSSG